MDSFNPYFDFGKSAQGRLRVILAVILVLAALSLSATAAPVADSSAALGVLGPTGRFATIPYDAALQKAIQESGIENMSVQFDGLEETLASYSRILLSDLTGRESIHGQDPVYSVLSMIYQPEHWLTAEIFPVESPWLGKFLGFPPAKKWMSVADFYHSPNRDAVNELAKNYDRLQGRIKTQREVRNTVIQARTVGLDEAGIKAWTPDGMTVDQFTRLIKDPRDFQSYAGKLEKLEAEAHGEKAHAEVAGRLIQRVEALVNLSGTFLVVPDPNNFKGEWTTPWGKENQDKKIAAAGHALDTALDSGFKTHTVAGIRPAVARFLSTVEPLPLYPSPTHRWARTFYMETQPFRKVAWIYLLSVLAWGVWGMTRSRWVRYAAIGLLGTGFALHTASEIMRLYLTGHMPVSDMYESITFASWGMMLVGVVLSLVTRRQAFAVGAGAMGFLALTLVGFMPLHETRIHALRAVLNSYWLNIHVTMMLMSYGTFLLAGILSAAYLIVSSVQGRGGLSAWTGIGGGLDRLELYAYRCVQVGWPLLTVGIFLGGVWAETAWGRFWGWDPKETWALITWIVYTLYLHSRMVLGWRGRISAIAGVLGLIAVLVTWLGVSYLPGLAGGLHSYASPTG